MRSVSCIERRKATIAKYNEHTWPEQQPYNCSSKFEQLQRARGRDGCTRRPPVVAAAPQNAAAPRRPPWRKDERALGFRPRPEASWAVAGHGPAVARWLGQGRTWASAAAQGVHGQRRRRALQWETFGPPAQPAATHATSSAGEGSRASSDGVLLVCWTGSRGGDGGAWG